MTVISGPSAFYNEIIPPTGPPPENMDPRAAMAIWQLSISTLILRDFPNPNSIRYRLLSSLSFDITRVSCRSRRLAQ